MKKTELLNSEISYLISKMGHTDSLAICDAGLPIPNSVPRIDLALKAGVPSFIEVLQTVLSELKSEEALIANEITTASEKSKQVYSQLKNILDNHSINLEETNHEFFKQQTQNCKAIIRTGETTPYANIILKSGVVF